MKRIEGKGTYDSVKIGEGGVYLKKKNGIVYVRDQLRDSCFGKYQSLVTKLIW